MPKTDAAVIRKSKSLFVSSTNCFANGKIFFKATCPLDFIFYNWYYTYIINQFQVFYFFEVYMVEVVSNSPLETEAFANKLSQALSGGETIAYFGGLGMGKTRFTAGLAKGMGITEDVSSPTFSLVHEYRGDKVLYHFDMYRITTFEDLCSTGFFDYLDWGGVLAVEWSENIENALPEDKLIKIEIMRGETDDQRILRMSGDSIYEDSWR